MEFEIEVDRAIVALMAERAGFQDLGLCPTLHRVSRKHQYTEWQ